MWLYADESAGYGAAYCKACQLTSKRKGQCNDCEACEGRKPDISKVRKYLDCFMLCDSQFRATGGNVFALDWSVVIQAAESMDIAINRRFFSLLSAFEGVIIKEVQRGKSGS